MPVSSQSPTGLFYCPRNQMNGGMCAGVNGRMTTVSILKETEFLIMCTDNMTASHFFVLPTISRLDEFGGKTIRMRNRFRQPG